MDFLPTPISVLIPLCPWSVGWGGGRQGEDTIIIQDYLLFLMQYYITFFGSVKTWPVLLGRIRDGKFSHKKK